jgi:hypothetical protein
LEWLLLTTRPVETLDQALEIIAWYSRRWTVEEFCCAALRVTKSYGGIWVTRSSGGAV